MEANFVLASVLLVAGIALCGAETTLTCYSCTSSKNDDPCTDVALLDKSNITHTETCTGPEAACVLLISQVYGISAGDESWDVYPKVYSRFCATTHPIQSIGCTSSSGIKGQQKLCLCDDRDKCNSSSKPALYITAILLSLIVGFIL